jgi:hypothetical protein
MHVGLKRECVHVVLYQCICVRIDYEYPTNHIAYQIMEEHVVTKREGVSSLYVSHSNLVKGVASGKKPSIKQLMHILLSKLILVFVTIIYDLRCDW